MDIFGYYTKDGNVVRKFRLPKGIRPYPSEGMIFVRVADQAALDAIQLYVSAPTIDEQIQDQRNAFVDALISDDQEAQDSIKATALELQAQKDILSSDKVSVKQ